jgi:hypothetical protein
MIKNLYAQLRLEFPYPLTGSRLSYPVQMGRLAYAMMVSHITDEAKMRNCHKCHRIIRFSNCKEPHIRFDE